MNATRTTAMNSGTRLDVRPTELEHRLTTVLLVSGIVAPLWWAAQNIVAAMRFPGYSTVSQTISELSAIGAPTRPLWVWTGVFYSALLVAFAAGIWRAARGRRTLRIVGGLLVADALIAAAWPPMHLRGEPTSLTDTLHIVWTGITLPMVMVAIGVAAFAFGRRFRLYSFATIVMMLAFGALTGIQGPRIPEGLPTPFIGLWERIAAAAFMVWYAVLAVMLIRAVPRGSELPPHPRGAPAWSS